MKEKHSSIKNWDSLMDPSPDYHLKDLYQQCVAEIGVQQSKRDQIIAFFIAICSFVIPAIFEMKDLSLFSRSVAFLLLFILGIMLSGVVARYRIYKEAYWLAVRVISRLFGLKRECVNKEVVQQCFAETMHKNFKKVVVYAKNKKGLQKPRLWKTLRMNRGSAELILYKVMVLMTAALGVLCVESLGAGLGLPTVWRLIADAAVLVSVYLWLCLRFCRALCDLYRYCVDGEKASFNKTYSKAWFLHLF